MAIKEKLIKVMVTSKQAGFRRLGRAWPSTQTEVEVSEADLKTLQDTEMLVVHVLQQPKAE